MKVITILQLTGVFCLLATDVYAYIDPATGSMVIQMLIGAAAGAYLFFRSFWSRILNFLGFTKAEEPSHEEDDDAVQSQTSPRSTVKSQVLEKTPSTTQEAHDLAPQNKPHRTLRAEVLEETHSSKGSASS